MTMDIYLRRTAPPARRTVLQALAERYRVYREKRRFIAELRSLDPRILKDLAIDRSEAGSLVYSSKPLERRRACS